MESHQESFQLNPSLSSSQGSTTAFILSMKSYFSRFFLKVLGLFSRAAQELQGAAKVDAFNC